MNEEIIKLNKESIKVFNQRDRIDALEQDVRKHHRDVIFIGISLLLTNLIIIILSAKFLNTIKLITKVISQISHLINLTH